MNRTRRTVAILAGSRMEAIAIAHRRGIPLSSVLWPESARVLVNARELRVLVPPSFESHPKFEEIADWLQRHLNPHPARHGAPSPLPALRVKALN